MLTQLWQWLGFAKMPKKTKERIVVPRAQHNISRKEINQAALKVLYRLQEAGFEAYLVGGGVRDLLLGQHPKDFDIATNATPEQVYRLFRNSRMIGRRFKLVHVFFGSYIVEVATFRAPQLKTDRKTAHSKIQHSQHGMIVRDNLYGSLEEDVLRRDFTVNALYYTVSNFSVIDYVGGLKDLEARSLRMIGDARLRYREDPVRMLRAIRFAAKLDFTIHPETAKPILELAELVRNVAAARLFEECIKLFFTGYAVKSFLLLKEFGLLRVLFPILDDELKSKNHFAETFIVHALEKTDVRIQTDQPVAIPFLLATLLWPAVCAKHKALVSEGDTKISAFLEAINWTLKAQQQWVAIPKRLTQMTQELWRMQMHLSKQQGQRAQQLFLNPRFRAAYDFLMLRAEAGDAEVAVMAAWWSTYIASNEETRLKMATEGHIEFQKRKQKEKRRAKTPSKKSTTGEKQ